MSYAFSPADVAYLRGPAGQAAVAEIAREPLTEASRLADVARARALAGPMAAVVLETAMLRRKAALKLDGAADWLFTDPALQQATASPVARHRALRLAGRDVHDVTCSIGADLTVIAGVAGRCVGSDLDPVRLAMAQHNCASAGVAPALLRADALHPTSRDTVIVADPARRDEAGRRRWQPADLLPRLDLLAEVYAGRDLAVKCSPGLDFAAVDWAQEIELVSLDGTVREACLWTGELAGTGITRRATVLRHDRLQWTITDADPDDAPIRPVGAWLVDPDGAVVRAGLVRHYAVRHGLGQLDPRIAYLTGDAPPPGIRAFRVLEHGKYSEKTLRSVLRSRSIGTLEILVRGLDVDPNTLRRRLKLAGAVSATVVLTRIGDTPTAILCEAVRSE
ncbi:MAG TPA: class I SAM-dependent methyltransferase [Pseudonocardiaceae bacterium]|nr:class I SAM-dependent methyltransferase [Pseudonocardiaceae bacterium]